jgi:hypothetical protein
MVLATRVVACKKEGNGSSGKSNGDKASNGDEGDGNNKGNNVGNSDGNKAGRQQRGQG